eukprot:scaffold133228_cov63-Phaeocystis_antarctica.AAC.1
MVHLQRRQVPLQVDRAALLDRCHVKQPRQRAVTDGLPRVTKGGARQLAVGDAAERVGRHLLQRIERLLP